MTEVRVEEACPACKGARKRPDGYACSACGGTGKQSKPIPLQDLAERVAKILRGEGDR